MIHINTFFTPNEIPISWKKDNIIVVGVDILRAGTTICKALYSGAKEVLPVESSEEATKIFSKFDKGTTLLCGEKNCKKIDGYHLGNSPLEYTEEVVSSKTLILKTTNGTPLFRKFNSLPYFFIGGFVNLTFLTTKIVELLNTNDIKTVFLACAGQDNKFAFEDALFCGNLIEKLVMQYSKQELKLNDASLASIEMFLLHKADLANFVKTIEHSVNLIQSGFETDVDFSFQNDTIPIIPTFNGLSIVPLR